MNIRGLAALATLGGVALLQPVAASAATFTILHSFTDNADGVYPNALIEQNGVLYGTSQWDTTGELEGTVFSIDTGTGAYTVLHDFANTPDGSKPSGRLLYTNNLLYGTTSQGGSTGNGTVFSVVPSSGKEKVLYSFAGGSDGILPGSLVSLNGLFYGTASQGGDANCICGVIFSVNPANGAEQVLYRFKGGTDGNGPSGDLAVVGSKLYGSTFFGGTSSAYGTVYSYDTATETETVLYRFQGGTDGLQPTGGLTYQAGLLYGTTSRGGQGCVPKKRGVDGCGTVYSVDPSTGNETVIYRLSGMKGPALPYGDVTFVNGSLYTTSFMGGTTKCGRIRHEGPYNCGTIFSVNPATGAATVRLNFGGSTGALLPLTGLVFDGSNFFGTTNYGGPAGFGTVFEFTP